VNTEIEAELLKINEKRFDHINNTIAKILEGMMLMNNNVKSLSDRIKALEAKESK